MYESKINFIERRVKHNKTILNTIEWYLQEYPDIRFGQALINLGVLTFEDGRIKDPFNEEPWDTADRMKGYLKDK